MAIDVDGGVLWLGFFRGVRVVGGGGSERQKGNIYRKIWKFKAPKRSKHAG